MSWPRSMLSGVIKVLLAHESVIAILDPGNPGLGINCTCGRNFPPRVPATWVPPDYTAQEWADADLDERRTLVDLHQIRVKTAAEDFYDHLAAEILTYVTTPGTGYKLVDHQENLEEES